jgi:hypothetical protein
MIYAGYNVEESRFSATRVAQHSDKLFLENFHGKVREYAIRFFAPGCHKVPRNSINVQ